jgi:CRP-like cAMP-binding protein
MSLSGLFPIDRWTFTTRFVLKSLSQKDKDALLARQTTISYMKGEVIFRENTVPSGIYLILSGKVKKYRISGHAKAQIIYVAGQGELVGYHAILSEERYPDSAAAMEDCKITYIPKEDFTATLYNSPSFSRYLLQSLSHEFTVYANMLSTLMQHSASERLAIALIILREKFKEGLQDGGEIVITVSRSDLGAMSGLAVENVIRLLRDFKTQKIIAIEDRNIIVRDIRSLVKQSNYP